MNIQYSSDEHCIIVETSDFEKIFWPTCVTDVSVLGQKAGMWPRARHLDLEVVSRPNKALVSSQTDWQTPRPHSRFQNRGSRSWYRSQTVRPRTHPW